MALVISHVTSYDSRYQDSSARRGGDYQVVELIGDRLYAGCHCWGSHSSAPGPTPIPYSSNLANSGGTHTGAVSAVVAYDAITGARVQSFDPYMAGDLGAFGLLGASDGCLWIAGGINAVGQPGAQIPGRDLVRLCDEAGPATPPVPAPASCVATIAGDTVSVTWDEVDEAVDYVIYRSVDGGPLSWRGRVTSQPFTDTNRDASLVYHVAARDIAEIKSALTECATDIVVEPPQGLDPPASCTAVISGDDITVRWDAVGAAAEYIVYRSVDGGTQYWRGVSATTSFADTNRDGQLTYYVASKAADGERSDRRECQTTDVTPPPEPVDIDEVASCDVVVDPGGAPTATVTWPAIAPPDAGDPDPVYVIYRSVDGGAEFWRGRADTTSFTDDLRSGDIAYFVEVKVGNDRSDRTACQPVIQVP